jgi:RNA polymerase sigma factor (sigma-70 family)
MLVKRLTNTDVMVYLHNFAEMPDMKITQGDELVRRLSFIPLSLAYKYKKFPNYKDLLQVGYETLWKSIVSFDVTKGDNFFCWAYLWIKQKIAKEALKEKIYLETFVMSGLELESDEIDEFENILLRTEEENILKVAFSELSGERMSVMTEIYRNDRSLRDIGSDMNISHESVRKIRDDAVRVLKRIIDQKLIINT